MNLFSALGTLSICLIFYDQSFQLLSRYFTLSHKCQGITKVNGIHDLWTMDYSDMCRYVPFCFPFLLSIW